MKTIAVWLWISLGNGGINTTPVLLAQFLTQKDCQAAAAELTKQSEASKHYRIAPTACVLANVRD